MIDEIKGNFLEDSTIISGMRTDVAASNSDYYVTKNVLIFKKV